MLIKYQTLGYINLPVLTPLTFAKIWEGGSHYFSLFCGLRNLNFEKLKNISKDIEI